MPAVSIIVPVYNTEPYLRRCLDSLRAQLLTDIEVVAVDDASIDGSLEVLREYAARDARIRVIRHPQNMGLHVTRMTGVAASTGTYVGYVDSDDYVAETMFASLYARATEDDADIVRGGAHLYLTRPGEATCRTGELRFVERRFARGVDYLDADFYPSMCLHLHRRRLWELALPSLPAIRIVGEDNLTAFILAHLAGRVVTTADCDYHYMERLDSLSGDTSIASILHHIKDRARILSMLDAFVSQRHDAARHALEGVLASNRALVLEYIAGLTDERERVRAQAAFDEHWRTWVVPARGSDQS